MESLVNLKKVQSIREVYFLGNPCYDWTNYRALTIAIVPQLMCIDSKEITKLERIEANQNVDKLLDELEDEIQKQTKKVENMTQEDKDKAYTRESRRSMHEEWYQEKEENERKKNPEAFKPEKPQSSIYNNKGDMRQCNEGKYCYKLREWDDPDYSFFEMEISKFVDTKEIQCELFPFYVSVRIRKK